MKKLILLLTLVILFCDSAFSQNYIYNGDNQYESTNSWNFEMNGNYWTGNPQLTVAKHSNGGYLMIALDVPIKQHYIGGTVTVFLSDGSTIKCTDKGIRDHVDNQSIALYNFTKSEIELLKSHRITRVRFSIKGGMEGTETFTADNKKLFFQFYGGDQKKYYETNIEINELFE
ncbi:MAG: hypothetical protein NXI23_21535 [Bacteroidetes bacterium]|nr:hypothetical protein [Bacteroidota bacterium]